jgi:broad specificity polyphosphatase/5'/3'-nucleotidase SurE
MNTLKPLILVTNDDGVSAPDSIIAVMAEIGDVLVVAPEAPKRHGSCHNNKQHLIFKQNF